MLIHRITELRIFLCFFPIILPRILCSGTLHKRSRRSKQPDLRIFCMNSRFKPFITISQIQILRLPLLISNGKEIHTERLRMSHFGTQCAPFAVHRAISKLNEIQCILHIFLKFRTVRIHHFCGTELTRSADIQHRKRFCSQQFTQQEIFIKSKSKRLSIMCVRPLRHRIIFAPVIIKGPQIWNIAAVFHIPYRIFPVIPVIKADAFHDAAARETHKSRPDCLQCLKQIPPENSCHRIFRDHGDQVKLYDTRRIQRDCKLCTTDIIQRGEHCFVFHPLISAAFIALIHLMDFFNIRIQRSISNLHRNLQITERYIGNRFHRFYFCLCKNPSVFLYCYLKPFPFICHTSRIKRYSVSMIFLQMNAIICFICKSLSCLFCRKTQIMRIHCRNRSSCHILHQRLLFSCLTQRFPRISKVIYRIKSTRISISFFRLKRTVFNQLCIQTAVCRKINIFKK